MKIVTVCGISIVDLTEATCSYLNFITGFPCFGVVWVASIGMNVIMQQQTQNPRLEHDNFIRFFGWRSLTLCP